MFEGSKHHNRNYFEPLQKAGGVLNGSTALDRTNYWETVPSNYLELALWLESDRMGFLLDALDQKRFDIQRDVVKNERRQSYENRPYGSSYLLLQPALFPLPHPYNWPTIGSQEDLDAASLEDVKEFFREFYGPSNASLALAGDFDSDQAKRWIDEYFGDIPPGPPVTRVGRMASSLTGEVEIEVRDKVQLPRLYLVWPSVALLDDAEAPLDLLASVLGSGKSSRLYRSLIYDKQIASDVSVSNYSEEIAGEFGIQITASPGHTLEEIQDVVEAELRRIRQEPPSEREVARAKNRLESQVTRHLERVGGFGGRADQLNHYNVMAGDPGLINTDLERYLDVGPEEIMRSASEVLGEDRVHLSVLPEEQVSASTSTVDRTAMPSAAKAGTFSPAVPRRHVLPNGLNVLHVARSGVPLVALGLVLDAGAVTDTAQVPGVAHLTASMLTEGTSNRSSQQIADDMEFLGARVESTAGREHALASTETLAPHWETALEIVSDLIQNATFPENELERVRKERVADLSRIADDATAIAARAARALVYGPDSPYGRPITGTETSVSAITRDEVAAQFERRYGPENATLLVVGDVSEEEVLSRVEALLGDWQPGKTGPQAQPTVREPQASAATIYLADKPGAPQSVIRAGHLTVSRSHPDYYATYNAELPVRRPAHRPALHEPEAGQGLQLWVLLVHRLAHRAVGPVCGRLRRDGGDDGIGDRNARRVHRHKGRSARVGRRISGREGRHPTRLPGAVRDQRPDTPAAQQHRRIRAAGRLLLSRLRQHGGRDAGRHAPRGEGEGGRRAPGGAGRRRQGCRGARAGRMWDCPSSMSTTRADA